MRTTSSDVTCYNFCLVHNVVTVTVARAQAVTSLHIDYVTLPHELVIVITVGCHYPGTW